MSDGSHERDHGTWMDGAKAAVPIVLGYVPTAAAFGVATGQAGFTPVEAVLMSAIIFAGASQFALIGLLATGAPGTIGAAVATWLNLRHTLYGPSLAPHLRRFGTGKALLAAFGLTDEVFAVTLRRVALGSVHFNWLVALEASAYLAWVSGTWLGAVMGHVALAVAPSLAGAMGFALPALYLALVILLLNHPGRQPISSDRTLSVAAAAFVAALLKLVGMAQWSVLAGGLVGPAIALLWGRRKCSHVFDERV